jgi:hypothetical protein
MVSVKMGRVGGLTHVEDAALEATFHSGDLKTTGLSSAGS